MGCCSPRAGPTASQSPGSWILGVGEGNEGQLLMSPAEGKPGARTGRKHEEESLPQECIPEQEPRPAQMEVSNGTLDMLPPQQPTPRRSDHTLTSAPRPGPRDGVHHCWLEVPGQTLLGALHPT